MATDTLNMVAFRAIRSSHIKKYSFYVEKLRYGLQRYEFKAITVIMFTLGVHDEQTHIRRNDTAGRNRSQG